MLRHFSLVPNLWMQALKHRPLASPWFLVEAINKESKRRKMAPKKKPESDPSGMFSGMVVFLVPKGVQVRRLQVPYKFQVSPVNNGYHCTFFIFKTHLSYFHLKFQSLHLFYVSSLFSRVSDLEGEVGANGGCDRGAPLQTGHSCFCYELRYASSTTG